MDNVKKQDGFTLIEILVGINIAFLALTLIISFYLFMLKSFNSASVKFEKKQDDIFFFSELDRLLHKNESFYFVLKNDASMIVFEDSTSVLMDTASIFLKGISLKDLTEYSVTLSLQDGTVLLLNDGQIKSGRIDNVDKVVLSNDVYSADFEITKSGMVRNYRFVNPMVSARRFINISN